ncbi:MCE family protein [Actinomadura parmotrematis]|uniref:MCE family protein n=1 Tax=Actinomadura parmotrematis TaxID=2864039 RepID=A0ABS7FY08_9ACTN|nr:MlaD family protein [Actinomadura parmotrematis]MBW8485156.1 MCE family protein [Actinomadura parmotrematis]
MIIKRGVKIQLVVFLIITIVGVSIVSVRYLGVGRGVLGRQYTAYVDLSDSGGVFTNAEVTYRGVPVGRVGPIKLTRDGIKVQLKLEKGDGKRIPRDNLTAVVANRSAVGEQYIDLQPSKRTGPYLDEGAPYTIPRQNTKLPVSTAELLRNVDRLVSSIDPKNLGTIVDELDKAFNGSATDLQKILDDTDRILKTADEAYPDTKALLDNSQVVLNTQRMQGANIKGFARKLNELTASIRDDDKNIRADIDATPGAVTQANALVNGLAPNLPVFLANMTTTGQIITSRQAGLRSLFILYPVTVAGAFTVTPGDGTQHLGLDLNISSPPACTQGYEKTKQRWPQYTAHKSPRLDIGCTASPRTGTDVRGGHNFPKSAISPTPQLPAGATSGAGFPGGTASSSAADAGTEAQAETKDKNGTGTAASAQDAGDGGTYTASADSVEFAGYDPSTGVVYGPDGKKYALPRTAGTRQLGEESSWKWLLLGPLSQ